MSDLDSNCSTLCGPGHGQVPARRDPCHQPMAEFHATIERCQGRRSSPIYTTVRMLEKPRKNCHFVPLSKPLAAFTGLPASLRISFENHQIGLGASVHGAGKNPRGMRPRGNGIDASACSSPSERAQDEGTVPGLEGESSQWLWVTLRSTHPTPGDRRNLGRSSLNHVHTRPTELLVTRGGPARTGGLPKASEPSERYRAFDLCVISSIAVTPSHVVLKSDLLGCLDG
jgi:hypothetical protein